MPTKEYDETRVRWLSPEITSVFEGTYSLLHCTVKGDTLYRGVFAVRMFPVSFPEQFISLRYHDLESAESMIRRRLSRKAPRAIDMLLSGYFSDGWPSVGNVGSAPRCSTMIVAPISSAYMNRSW